MTRTNRKQPTLPGDTGLRVFMPRACDRHELQQESLQLPTGDGE
jgi:hypothetical protein